MDDKNGGPNHLQAWREFRRLTQEELGALVGTTGSVISLLENGERALSAKWLRRLAPALKTRAGWMLDFHPSAISDDVLDAWQSIPEERKEQALTVLKTFRRAS